MDEQYSLKQVASALCIRGGVEQRTRLMRNIQYWTSLGLLAENSPTRIGKGHHRSYTADDIYRTCLFEEVHRWQCPMTVVAESFFLVHAEFEDLWELAIDGTESVYLSYSWLPGYATWHLTTDDPHLVIIKDRLIGERSSDPPTLERPCSSLVLQLTRLFRSVKLPQGAAR